MLKNQVLTIIRNRQQEFITEDQIMNAITGRHIVVWTEEEHTMYNNMLSAIVELKSEGLIKSFNNGFNSYSYQAL